MSSSNQTSTSNSTAMVTLPDGTKRKSLVTPYESRLHGFMRVSTKKLTRSDIKIHKFEWEGKMYKMYVVDDRLDIIKLCDLMGVLFTNLQRDREENWNGVTELIKDTAIIEYSFKNGKGNTITLRCIPTQLIVSFLDYGTNDTLRDTLIAHLLQYVFPKGFNQFPQLKCNFVDCDGVILGMNDNGLNQYVMVRTLNAQTSHHGEERKEVERWLRTDYAKQSVEALIKYYKTLAYYKNGTYEEKLDAVYYKQYGETWLHREMAVLFAMWISPDFRMKIARMVSRIISGDYEVLPDIIGAIDHINNKTSLIKLYTFDKSSMQAPDFYRLPKHVIHNRLLDCEDELKKNNAAWQEKYTNVQQALKVSNKLIHNPEKQNEMLQLIQRIAGSNNRGKGTVAVQAMNVYEEMSAMDKMIMQQLERELEDTKSELDGLRQERDGLKQERDELASTIESFRDTIDELRRDYIDVSDLASKMTIYMKQAGLRTNLKAHELKLLNPTTVRMVEENMIKVDEKLAATLVNRDSWTEYKTGEPDLIEPRRELELGIQYLGDENDNMTFGRIEEGEPRNPIYIYGIKHMRQTDMQDWIVFKMGNNFRGKQVWSIILSPAPLTDSGTHNMFHIGQINLKPRNKEAEEKAIQEFKDNLKRLEDANPHDAFMRKRHAAVLARTPTKNYVGWRTFNMLRNYADGVCEKKQFHFTNGMETMFVMFSMVTDPKGIEEQLCQMLEPIIENKFDAHSTEMKWNDYLLANPLEYYMQ